MLGVEADAAQIEALIWVRGKTVEELVVGNEKLSSVPVGAAAPSGAAASGPTFEAATEEKEASGLKRI